VFDYYYDYEQCGLAVERLGVLFSSVLEGLKN